MQEPKHCDNCGAVLRGEFCSHCGQRARDPVVSLREFSSEALNDLFSVDSRIWRTFLPLLFKPGSLTTEYIAGRRERYLPPFRTYLVVSLLFFMMASILGTGVEVTINDKSSSEQEILNSDAEKEDFSCQEIEVGNLQFLEGRIRNACEKIRADSGSSLFRALTDNIPMMMFLFIPFIAVLMKFLYLFSRRKYVEHLLFLFHYHATFFLILTLNMIVLAIAEPFPLLATPTTIIAALGWIYIPVYLLLAMLRVYAQSWTLTNVKFLLLLTGYTFTLFLALAAATIFTALTL